MTSTVSELASDAVSSLVGRHEPLAGNAVQESPGASYFVNAYRSLREPHALYCWPTRAQADAAHLWNRRAIYRFVVYPKRPATSPDVK